MEKISKWFLSNVALSSAHDRQASEVLRLCFHDRLATFLNDFTEVEIFEFSDRVIARIKILTAEFQRMAEGYSLDVAHGFLSCLKNEPKTLYPGEGDDDLKRPAGRPRFISRTTSGVAISFAKAIGFPATSDDVFLDGEKSFRHLVLLGMLSIFRDWLLQPSYTSEWLLRQDKVDARLVA